MDFYGIIVYEIIERGNLLKGTYTNTDLNNRYQLLSDLVRKSSEGNDITGTYSCRFVENGDKSYIGELEILKKNEVFDFLWKVENESKIFIDTFKGIGLKAGDNHLAVSYWHI